MDTSIEQRLRSQASAMAAVWASQTGTARLMVEAADTIAEMRRALEAVDSSLLSYAAKLSEFGCESWIDHEALRGQVGDAMGRAKGA